MLKAPNDLGVYLQRKVLIAEAFANICGGKGGGSGGTGGVVGKRVV